MNYYERHIGDYLKDTAHLSLLEHGVYTRLIDVYYTRESPIPEKEAARLIAARSKEEREALATVLAEFFLLEDGAYMQKRCEEELHAYHEGQEGAEDKKANDKERQRRARERRKALFDELRGHGIVPPWDTKTADLQTLRSRVTNTDQSRPFTQPVTRDNTATQAPVPSNQTPDTKRNTGESASEPPGNTEGTPPPAAAKATTSTPRATRMPCPEGVDTAVWDDWLTLRKAKRAPVTATVVDGAKAEAAKAGLTLEAFLRVWCRRGSQGLEAAWLKPDERALSANGRHPPPIDTATRNAESRRLLGFAPNPPPGEIVDA